MAGNATVTFRIPLFPEIASCLRLRICKFIYAITSSDTKNQGRWFSDKVQFGLISLLFAEDAREQYAEVERARLPYERAAPRHASAVRICESLLLCLQSDFAWRWKTWDRRSLYSARWGLLSLPSRAPFTSLQIVHDYWWWCRPILHQAWPTSFLVKSRDRRTED